MKIMVTGFLGKMGRTTVNMVLAHEGFDLVTLVNSRLVRHAEEVKAFEGVAPVFQTIEEALKEVEVDVAIDFTQPSVAYAHTKCYIEHNVHPVIGTTGFKLEEIEKLKALANAKELGGIIAPNFAIGAALMQNFAAQAAKYLPHVEIIEMHSDSKKDSPSETALKTAEGIAAHRGEAKKRVGQPIERISGTRGGEYLGIPIHSLRLPGYISSQMVQFGGLGEVLTIRQETYDRQSYMPGVKMACDYVMKSKELIYGLDQIL